MALNMKRYDTRTAIKALLKTPKGNAVDLTGAKVQFVMQKYSTKNVIANREATVLEPMNGSVCFTFEREETSELGLMQAEFKVTYVDGETETFPNSGYIIINFEKDLS